MEIIPHLYEKLLIYTITKTTYEKFLEDHVYMGNGNNPKWIDGYLIYFYPAADTEFIQRLEYEEHTIVWTGLEYCRMAKFKPEIKNKDQNSASRVTDLTNDATFQAIGKFLKERDKCVE